VHAVGSYKVKNQAHLKQQRQSIHSSKQWGSSRMILGRTTSWSPKSQCVYGPENEIAAVTFLRKMAQLYQKAIYFLQVNGMAEFRGTRLLIAGL